MPKINIPENLISEIWDIKIGSQIEMDGKKYEKVDEGDWDDEGKYQYKEIVFSLEGLFYSASISRSGSYFSDYNFDYPDEAYQVEKKEKTITVWEGVKEPS